MFPNASSEHTLENNYERREERRGDRRNNSRHARYLLPSVENGTQSYFKELLLMQLVSFDKIAIMCRYQIRTCFISIFLLQTEYVRHQTQLQFQSKKYFLLIVFLTS